MFPLEKRDNNKGAGFEYSNRWGIQRVRKNDFALPEELEKELQDGIRIEAKLYSPSEKYCQMEKYNLSDADFLALLESLPQKRKARLILSFTKSAFDLVIFNSEVSWSFDLGAS